MTGIQDHCVEVDQFGKSGIEMKRVHQSAKLGHLVRDHLVNLILDRSTHLQTGYLGTHTRCLIGKFRYKLIRDLFKFLGVAVRFSIINHFLLEAEKEIRRKLSSFELHYRKLHKNI